MLNKEYIDPEILKILENTLEDQFLHITINLPSGIETLDDLELGIKSVNDGSLQKSALLVAQERWSEIGKRPSFITFSCIKINEQCYCWDLRRGWYRC